MADTTFLLLLLISGCICRISAQLQCERRDEATAGRTCERACQADYTCRRSNKECVCDGRCGASCLRKICDFLEAPVNGSVQINPSGRFIGATAFYSCINGFVVEGNATRICQANKTWSGTAPTCRRSLARPDPIPTPALCQRLPPPLNGEVTFSQESEGSVVVGTIARFECHSGYSKTSGNLRRICRSGGTWSGSDLVCSIDVQCPRNDSEIQRQNRQCLRQCGRDSDCMRGRVCVCDDICGLSCILTDRADYCEELSSDLHVQVRITPNHRTFGSVARYECRSGHEVRGGSNERRCLGSGQWSGNPLNCFPTESCGQPPVIENSSHNGTKERYIEGEIVIYGCDYGFYRGGYLPLSRCDGNGWSEIQFYCSPKSCGDPGMILNGRRHGSSFIFRSSVEYTCDLGYELRGLPRRYCQADQRWSGSLPSCHPVVCSHLRHLANGVVIGSDFSYNKIVSFECNTRYIMEGQNTLRCQANSTWNGPQPTCRLIQCPPPEDPENGESDADLQFYGYQGTVRFSCNRGYTLRGSNVITCNENEEWFPRPPLCVGQCRIPQCPVNGRWSMFNGGYHGNCRNPRLVDPGTRLQYQCNYGYFKCEQTEPVCHDREWEPNVQPRCVRLGCDRLTLRDPQLTASYTNDGGRCSHPDYQQRGTVARYTCNLGYKIRDGDPRQATCIERNWSPRHQPVCVEVTCPQLGISNGWVNFNRNEQFRLARSHNTLASFFCGQGYTLDSQKSIFCDNGTWNDTTPRCVEDPCTEIYLYRYDQPMDVRYDFPPGSVLPADGRKPAGTTANFICQDRGFRTSDTKMCRLGVWRGQEPQCSRIPCADEALVNGDVTYTLDDVIHGRPEHGVTRSFNCHEGFTIDDGEPSVCEVGAWTKTLPVCNEIPCNKNDLYHGNWEIEFNYRGRRDEATELLKPPGTEATYRCTATGYVIAGQATNICRRGQWRGSFPLCERTTCPLMQFNNGRLEYKDINNSTITVPRHGDSRIAGCQNGYDLLGSVQTRCWDGAWENQLPICQEKPCNKNDLPTGDWEIEFIYPGGENEEAELMKPPGTEATFRCNVTGHVIAGQHSTPCRQGQWNVLNPSCERSTCQDMDLTGGELEYFTNDDNTTSIARHGDYRLATCKDGYHLQGTPQSRCWNGEWVNELPTCQENPCVLFNEEDVPDSLQVTYASRNGSRIFPNGETVPSRSVADFVCREGGLRLIGEAQRTCRKGRWKGMFPSCETAFCRIETIDNGNFTKGNGDAFTQAANHGDWGRFTCHQGYTIDGEQWSLCRSGEWTEEKPTCVEESCPLFANNGEYDRVLYQGAPSQETSFPPLTTLEVDCAEGRVHSGPQTSFCRRGSWDPPRLLCVEVAPCGEVTEEEGRNIVYTDNTANQKRQNSVLTVTCENNRIRDGQSTSRCLNGAWVPPVAVCKENLAFGKSAHQDSTGFEGHANRSVDGDTNGFYFIGHSCSHTTRWSDAEWTSPWWYVDLDSLVLVREIAIYNRQDIGHHARLLNARVRVGNHTQSAVTENQLVATLNVTNIYPIRIEVNPPVTGRIVSVSELNRGSPLTLCEVQVFGERLGCSNGCEVPLLENGFFTLNGYSEPRLQPFTCVGPRSLIFINCQHGLTHRGGHFYTCLPSGEWLKTSGVDTICHRCPAGQCVVPYIENGYYRDTRNGHPLSTGGCTSRPYLYVHCNHGMEIQGSYFYYCREGELQTRNIGNTLSRCPTGMPNEQQHTCRRPEVSISVETFVGNEYTPLAEQQTFRRGDVITSRCEYPQIQMFHGSVIRRCEDGLWSGEEGRCESSNFNISVINTRLQDIAENGTLIVYPVEGHVFIRCKLLNGLSGDINILKDERMYYPGNGIVRTQRSLRIDNPSEADSGLYTCQRGRLSHSINILFKAITCPTPPLPERGIWVHNPADANPDAELGYIFRETVSLACHPGYRASDSPPPTCTHHGTWSSFSQRCV